MTVEVRLACAEDGKEKLAEARDLLKARPGAHVSDLIVVDVAKSNVAVRNREPWYLHRRQDGVLEDITDAVFLARLAPQPVPANDDPGFTPDEERRIRAVATLIKLMTQGKPGAHVVRQSLRAALGEHKAAIDGLAKVDPATAEKAPKKGSLGWYCKVLLDRGHLRQKGKGMFVADLAWLDASDVVDEPQHSAGTG